MITLVATLFLVIAGSYTPSIVQIVDGRSYGGGPSESLYRIVTRTVTSAPLDEQALGQVAVVVSDSGCVTNPASA